MAKKKNARQEKNGIVRPKDGTTTGNVWKIADRLDKRKCGALRADVLEACEKAGINASTANTQYGKWRQFNGKSGTGRTKAEKKSTTAKRKATKKAAKKVAKKKPTKKKVAKKDPAKKKAAKTKSKPVKKKAAKKKAAEKPSVSAPPTSNTSVE